MIRMLISYDFPLSSNMNL